MRLLEALRPTRGRHGFANSGPIPYDLYMLDPTRPTLAEIMADLDASEAETGPGVPAEEVHAKIDAVLARLDREGRDPSRKTARSR